MTTENASALLERVARGDGKSFEDLYDRYAPMLYAVLLRILGRPEDAQEVLQETFVKVWTNATLFDKARGSEAAWLISIARSRGIDRLRSRRVRFDRETEAGREITHNGPAASSPSGLEAAVQSETRTAVRSALSELPQAQRIALELAYFEGLSQSEIAERLGEPLGTVKTRMQLGMKKLRDRLQELR